MSSIARISSRSVLLVLTGCAFVWALGVIGSGESTVVHRAGAEGPTATPTSTPTIGPTSTPNCVGTPMVTPPALTTVMQTHCAPAPPKLRRLWEAAKLLFRPR